MSKKTLPLDEAAAIKLVCEQMLVRGCSVVRLHYLMQMRIGHGSVNSYRMPRCHVLTGCQLQLRSAPGEPKPP